MFGIYRYGLAFCVAISHLWAGMIGGPAAFAVWGFYCLSGYLMALILNEKYEYNPRGLVRFAVNRFLRIYPAYYVVSAGMVMLFILIPGTATRFLPHLHMPTDVNGWLFSCTLMTPLGGEFVHGSSALRVELWFYVLMALGLARGKPITLAWFFASCLYTGWQLCSGASFPDRYVWVPSCSLAFSFGALIYHYRGVFPTIRTPWPAVVAAVLWWAHVWLSWRLPGGPFVTGLYTSMLFSAIAMVTLMRLEPKQMPPWLRRLDHVAGNLSYPIYLCHWGVGIVITWFLPSLSRESFWVFLIGFPLVNLLAYAIHRFVEEPTQSWKLPSGLRLRAVPAGVVAGTVRVDLASRPSMVSRVAAAVRGRRI
jgi:peptidoglycan/LPS O-acetylase OafA/YrhL